MKVADRKTLTQRFKEGLLKPEAVVEALAGGLAEKEAGWRLLIENTRGDKEAVALARTAEAKTYRSIEAAVQDARDIGCKRVVIEMT